MKTFFFILMTFVSIQEIKAQVGDRQIVGGEPVTDINEAPFIVSLSGACGGSLVSSKWVLTAAHCAGHFREVKGGMLNLGDTGIVIKVKQVITHPQYNSRTFANDFAVVELEKEVDLRRRAGGIRVIRLATPEMDAAGIQKPGTVATVYGWGNIEESRPNSSKNLNKVEVPIVAKEVANQVNSYNGKIDDTMLAAGYAQGKKDSCQGDSGGPMIVRDSSGNPIQIGIVSWGAGCARPNKYGIYSKVSHGFAWVKTTIDMVTRTGRATTGRVIRP